MNTDPCSFLNFQRMVAIGYDKNLIDEFHCFTVHFNSLNFTHQLMHFYI